jgi:hypothetical protein
MTPEASRIRANAQAVRWGGRRAVLALSVLAGAVWLMIASLMGLVTHGQWNLAVFAVALPVAAGVAGKILAEGFIFVSDARQ